MAFLSGIGGGVMVGATAYKFRRWKVTFRGKLPPVNNFTSAYQVLVAGLVAATVTLSGPYDQGGMAFSCTGAYTFTLQWSQSVSLTVPCLLESIDGEQDVEAAATAELVGQSTGAFTAAIT